MHLFIVNIINQLHLLMPFITRFVSLMKTVKIQSSSLQSITTIADRFLQIFIIVFVNENNTAVSTSHQFCGKLLISEFCSLDPR